ncbi:hypothetical protein CRG98_050079, partial [Punica granatum]
GALRGGSSNSLPGGAELQHAASNGEELREGECATVSFRGAGGAAGVDSGFCRPAATRPTSLLQSPIRSHSAINEEPKVGP